MKPKSQLSFPPEKQTKTQFEIWKDYLSIKPRLGALYNVAMKL